ncbi:MAG: DUF4169 family protein [Pseudomonadota bacterium]
MTGPVVNLNKARKARAKTAKRAQADENAIKFGRTKSQKASERAERGAADTRLNGHKRDKTPEN